MARRKETELEERAMDFAREIMKAREDGKFIGLAGSLKEVMNAFMRFEREIFLQSDPDNDSNGFYDRKLN